MSHIFWPRFEFTRVRPIPEFTDTTDTDTLELDRYRYRVPIPIPVVTAQWAWRKWFHAIMREHAAGLLKHSKNIAWSKTRGVFVRYITALGYFWDIFSYDHSL